MGITIDTNAKPGPYPRLMALIALMGFLSAVITFIFIFLVHLAYEVYAHRLKTYLGAYTWLLYGADAIVFTDDVGRKSWKLREKVCSGVVHLGLEIDVISIIFQ